MIKIKLSYLLIIIGFIILLCFLCINLKDLIYYSNNVLAYNKYDSNVSSYFGVLKIEKINLNGVVYYMNSKNNNVNKNIYLANDDKNLIVLAAHSGNSKVSYFVNLHKISVGDKVNLIWNDYLRTYEIFEINYVDKTGTINVKSYNYPIILLVTCSKTLKDKQVIYFGRLIKSDVKL